MTQNGYAVFICDNYVKELYAMPEIARKIRAILPDLDITNRKAIAKIIYKNPEKKKQLEQLLHPLVRKKMLEFIAKYRDEQVIFLEVPLLFESGFDSYCTHTISLLCPKNIRKDRAIGRGIDPDIFESIDKIQMPESEKKKRASFAIDSSGTMEEVVENFSKAIDTIFRS